MSVLLTKDKYKHDFSFQGMSREMFREIWEKLESLIINHLRTSEKDHLDFFPGPHLSWYDVLFCSSAAHLPQWSVCWDAFLLTIAVKNGSLSYLIVSVLSAWSSKTFSPVEPDVFLFLAPLSVNSRELCMWKSQISETTDNHLTLTDTEIAFWSYLMFEVNFVKWSSWPGSAWPFAWLIK